MFPRDDDRQFFYIFPNTWIWMDSDGWMDDHHFGFTQKLIGFV